MYGWSTQLNRETLQKISTRLSWIFFSTLLFIQPVFSQEVKDDLRKKAREAAKGLTVLVPHSHSPVSVNAKSVWSEDKKQLAVILKVEVLDEWHIYAYVPPDQPYIQSELRLLPPEQLVALDKWETPIPYPYADGIFIYKGSLVFIRYFSVTKPVENLTVEVGLYFQTCNFSECLPPELEMIKISL